MGKIEQTKFLHDQLYAFAYAAAVGHGRVYTSVEEDKTKEKVTAFKREAKQMIMEMAKHYYKAVEEKKHVTNILTLSYRLSKNHQSMLAKNEEGKRRFRIGTAQKLLNLYLKYLWVAGEILPSPPHCPFDRIVIRKIMATWFGLQDDENIKKVKKELLEVNWTELDQISDKDGKLGYCSLVKYAWQCKGVEYPTLAEWELAKYNAIRPI